MKFVKNMVVCIVLMVICLSIMSCTKKKEAKVLVSEQEFVLRQDSESTFTIDAKGKIRNVGEVDLKKVVVTAYCRSCSDQWIIGQWIITPEIEKMPNQKDIINYISVGNEESFSFEEVTDLRLLSGQLSPDMPEKLEIVIESFETVEG